MTTTALITGGSGEIATFTRPHLAALGWTVRLLDTAPPKDALRERETFVEASILDVDAVAEAAAGADLVVHYAAHRAERPWPEILSINIDGTRAVLEAAERAGVRRMLLASTIHAVGFHPTASLAGTPVPLPRPDTYYGVSKAALEALGALFADTYGMSIVSARIVAATAEPSDAGSRVFWFSPGDSARLVRAVAELDRPGHSIVWGVSRGAGDVVDLGPGRAIGYDPQDDAREPGDADEIASAGGPAGGSFTTWPLGVTMA